MAAGWRRPGRVGRVVSGEQHPRDLEHCREHLSHEDSTVGAAIAAGATDLEVTDDLDSQSAEHLLQETVALVLHCWAEIEVMAVALLEHGPVMTRQQVQEVLKHTNLNLGQPPSRCQGRRPTPAGARGRGRVRATRVLGARSAAAVAQRGLPVPVRLEAAQAQDAQRDRPLLHRGQ